MGVLSWITEHWFDLLQSGGIIASLWFTAHSLREETKMRRLGNLLSIAESHRNLWNEPYERPHLFRVLERNVDLTRHPVSDEERLFVRRLILHLDSVRRAAEAGLFVKLEGLLKDVKDFLSLPIPRSVWERMEPFQDKEFIGFVDACRNQG